MEIRTRIDKKLSINFKCLHRKLIKFSAFQHVSAGHADSWPKTKICWRFWTWSRFKTKTMTEFQQFSGATFNFPTFYRIGKSAKIPRKFIDTAKMHPNRRQRKRRKIMTVWSPFVVLFSVVENMHINSNSNFWCYAAHDFYYSPYYAAGSSTFPIVFMLLPCRVA